jgi:hypothetical protein
MSQHQLDPKALARIRRDAMRQRARRIRRSVTGLALALFTAAFVGIYVQLASGHDPALSKRHTATTTAAASSTESSSGEAGSTSSEEASGGESTGSESSTESSSTGSEAATESPSAVTTRQS